MKMANRKRFVLSRFAGDDVPGYIMSFDTWEEAEFAFAVCGMIPLGVKLYDTATGRTWWPGAKYEWEAAQT